MPDVTGLGSVVELADRAAQSRPGRTLLSQGVAEYTHADLVDRSRSIAAEFVRRRIGRGERVLLDSTVVFAAAAALFGCLRAGCVAVPVNGAAPEPSLEHVIDDCDPAAVVSAPGSRLARLARNRGRAVIDPASMSSAPPRLCAVPGGCVPDDPALIIYTSGSSGRPRGVVVTHGNVLFATSAIAQRLGLRADDVIGCLLPFEFDYGLYQVFLALQSGARLVWGEPRDAGSGMLDFLVSHAVSVLPAVPVLAHGLCLLSRSDSRRRPALRMITSTGSPFGTGLLEELRHAYPNAAVYPMFGLTECKRVSILLPSELGDRPGSVGRPLPGTSCSIVDSGTSREVPIGTVGELVVRGPHVALGYWGGEGERPVRFRVCPQTGERSLFTGDQCSMDADGYLYYVGRTDDLYKAHGYRVSALEVALAAQELPGVGDSYCLAPRGGAEATLFVVTALSGQQVRRELAARLEEYKIPRRIVPVERLPRTPRGKVDATALAASQ